MADAELNVVVKVSDDGGLNKTATRFNELIDKWKAGKASIDETREAARIAQKFFTSWGDENEKLKKGVAETAVVLKNDVNKRMQEVASSAQKNQKAYFDLGREMRVWFIQQRAGDRVMREFGQTTSMLGNLMGMGGLTGVINTAQGSFQQMQFAMVAAGKSMENFGGQLKGIGTNMVAMSGWVAGAVAAIALLTLAIQDQIKKTKELAEARKAYREALLTSGGLSPEQVVTERTKDLADAQKKLKEVSKPGIGEKVMGVHHMMFRALGLPVPKEFGFEEFLTEQNKQKTAVIQSKTAQKNAIQTVDEARKKSMLLAEEEGNAEMDFARAMKEVRWQEMLDISEEVEYYWRLQDAVTAANDAKAAGQELARQKREENEERRRARQGGGMGWRFDENGEIQLDLEDQMKAASGKAGASIPAQMEKSRESANAFTSDLSSGIMNATQGLTQGFINSFNLGEGLLGQFAASMLSTFAQIGTKALIGNVLSMIPGLGFLSAIGYAEGGILTEPVVGVGVKSGRVHTFAERGPESFSPMNAIGQSARYEPRQRVSPSISVVPIVNNTGLAVQVEIGNRVNKTNRRF